MKKGKTITELAQELEDIRRNAKDLIVPTQKMRMETHDGKNVLTLNNGEVFYPTAWSHQQISTYSDIPKAYYNRINSENPGLLSASINHGFAMAVQKALESKRVHGSRMLRTINGNIRGFLSSKYRRLDCWDLLDTTFPVLMDHRFKIISAELTEKRMYLKAVTDRVQAEVKKGMVVQFGLSISSSDVGAGSVQVNPLMYELVCDNGAIMESAVRKFHIGKNLGSDSIEELLTDETKALDDKAFWHKIRDVVIGSMRPEIFQHNVNKLRVAEQEKLMSFDIPKIVNLTMKEVGVSGERHKDNIVSYLAQGADGRGWNRWSLANAFTWAAQAEDATYEEATELERAGGKILELPRNRWYPLSKAA
ncbi:MAG: hypothetical protein HQK83_11765 [Fibrobacteria bacterium]|nr:hypothetical protein [Fibrobacteria bacterium]